MKLKDTINNEKKPYLPNERGYFDQEPQIIKSYSEKDCTILPDPVTDPIVSNNIAWLEFDYTSPAEEYADLHYKTENTAKTNSHKRHNRK